MAVIATKLSNADGNINTVRASLFADDKSDVKPGMKIIGLSDDYVLEMGSSVITAAGEGAFLKSDGTWNWISGGGGGGGTNDYNDLINKPKINGTELEGDVSSEDISVGVTYSVDPTSDTLVIK